MGLIVCIFRPATCVLPYLLFAECLLMLLICSIIQIFCWWSSADCGMYYAGVCGKARVRCGWGSEFNGLAVHSAWKSWGMLESDLEFCVLSQYVFNRE